MRRVALKLVTLLVGLVSCIPSSQFPDVGLPPMLRDPLGLNAPSITTSFDDRSNDVPLADSFVPAQFEPLVSLPRGPNGGFLLRPGAFEMIVESYCLHAGTYGPSGGDGYLYAPLKGQASGVIRNILRRSVQHEEIAQYDIQVLLWAILARAKLSNMAPATQLAATVLLTPEELLQLNGGVLSLIPAEMLQGLLAQLPEPVRATVQAESQLREMLSQAGASYEALERVAVLSGFAPPEGVVEEVPRGRWSSHPGGFFVRYLPTSYSQTLLQLFVPASFIGSEGGFTGGGGETGGGGAGGSYEYDPSGDVAVPGNTSSQRLGLSPRPHPVPLPPPRPYPVPVGGSDEENALQPVDQPPPKPSQDNPEGNQGEGNELGQPSADSPSYVVRLQAQGNGLEKSVVLPIGRPNSTPVTVAEGLAGLEMLKGMLSKKQLAERAEFFQRAERFIRNAPAGGGVAPPGKSFNRPGSNIRVDVEILRGTNFKQ